MIQQTVDLDIGSSGETLSENRNQAMQSTFDADQKSTLFQSESTWNSQASSSCRNTGVHHVALPATNPAASAAAGGANGTATAPQRRQFKYVPAETGPSYWSPVDRITFLLTGEETGGAFCMAEVSVAPGGGPPPHIHHREEETFYLQQGTLTIQVGDKTLNASPGDFVCLPRGVAHSFKNTGEVEAKFLFVAAPAGLENFFAEAFDPAGDRTAGLPPMTEAFLAKLLAAAPKYGLEFVPPA